MKQQMSIQTLRNLEDGGRRQISLQHYLTTRSKRPLTTTDWQLINLSLNYVFGLEELGRENRYCSCYMSLKISNCLDELVEFLEPNDKELREFLRSMIFNQDVE